MAVMWISQALRIVVEDQVLKPGKHSFVHGFPVVSSSKVTVRLVY